MPTTMSGIEAHQFIYTDKWGKCLCIVTVKAGKAYYLIYRSELHKYLKFLPIVEQMISSVELLS